MQLVSPSPTDLRGLGERHELPSGVRGRAPAANAFLAYLKPTEQPIKSSIFRKRPLNQSSGADASQGSERIEAIQKNFVGHPFKYSVFDIKPK